MQIHVYHSPQTVTGSQMRHSTVIVVDVLRSTTSIVRALMNGATQVIPTAEAGEAVQIHAQLGRRESVLAGESGGEKLIGFELGNSPQEFAPETVRGKAVIMKTSNGTAAILHARDAGNTLIGAMINRTAAAKEAIRCGTDILIVCAGTDGQFSADDIVCAGSIVDAIRDHVAGTPEMNDLACMSLELYRAWKNGSFDLSRTAHYARLMQLGFTEDIRLCFTEDTTNVVPAYRNSVIR